MGTLVDLTGQTFGSWTVIRRAPSRRSGRVTVVHWLCRCGSCGTEKAVASNNLRNGRSTRCLDCHPRAGRPQLPMVTYRSLHERLRRERGRAVTHRCVDCGQRAAQWSLDDYRDDDLVEPTHCSRYSLDLDRYRPRCQPCHAAHDARLRAHQPTDHGSAAQCPSSSPPSC